MMTHRSIGCVLVCVACSSSASPAGDDAGVDAPASSCGTFATDENIRASCATCQHDSCCAAEGACSDDAECKLLSGCVVACAGRADCMSSCRALHASGTASYDAYGTCITTSCADACTEPADTLMCDCTCPSGSIATGVTIVDCDMVHGDGTCFANVCETGVTLTVTGGPLTIPPNARFQWMLDEPATHAVIARGTDFNASTTFTATMPKVVEPGQSYDLVYWYGDGTQNCFSNTLMGRSALGVIDADTTKTITPTFVPGACDLFWP